MIRSGLLMLGLLPLLAQAGVYKCVDHQGHTSFSQQPCPPEGGTTTQMRHLPVTPKARAFEPPVLPEATADNVAERYRSAMLWVLDSYPLLNPASPEASFEAIREFERLSRDSMALGEDPAAAVIAVSSQVAERHVVAPEASSLPALTPPAPPEKPRGLRVIGLTEEEAGKPRPERGQQR